MNQIAKGPVLPGVALGWVDEPLVSSQQVNIQLPLGSRAKELGRLLRSEQKPSGQQAHHLCLCHLWEVGRCSLVALSLACSAL